MTALLEKVWGQVSQLPEAEQDAVAVQLMRTLAMRALDDLGRGNAQEGEKPRPRFGSARGLGYMTEDFEEPLEEFNEQTR